LASDWAELRVRLSAADFFQVGRDEVIRVRPGLRTVGHRLARVLRHGGGIGGRQCLDRGAVGGREDDLLLGELNGHLIADEGEKKHREQHVHRAGDEV
jgi:hypothetical protein